MTSAIQDESFSIGWGGSKIFPLTSLSACLVEIHTPAYPWSRSPFTPIPESIFAPDLFAKLKAILDRVIKAHPLPEAVKIYKKVEAGQNRKRSDPSAVHPEASTVSEGRYSALDSNQAWIERLIPILAFHLLAETGESLTITKEYRPFSLLPLQQRGTRHLQRQELVKRLVDQVAPKIGQIPLETVIPEIIEELDKGRYSRKTANEDHSWVNVASSIIWDPSPILLLMTKQAFQDLWAENMSTLELIEVEPKGHGTEMVLLPKKYGDLTFLGAWVNLLGRMRLAPFGGVPTEQILMNALTDAPKNSPMRRDLEQFRKYLSQGGEGHPDPRWWMLQKDLDRAADA